MQSLSPATSKLNITATFQNMVRTEGIFRYKFSLFIKVLCFLIISFIPSNRPIRGVTAVVAGAGPAHALYFGSYELSKELMTKVTTHNHINYSKSSLNEQLQFLVNLYMFFY